MSYAEQYPLELGDRIVVSMPFFTKHYAIYVGFINGQEWLVQNTADKGVHWVLATKFFAESGACSVNKFTGTSFERQQVAQRAMQHISKSYNLLFFNCEHYANYIQYGEPASPQVFKGLFFGAIALALYKS